MSPATASPSDLLEDDELLEDEAPTRATAAEEIDIELEEEDAPAPKKKKKKKAKQVRKILHEDNVYIFTTADEAVEGAKALRYDNNAPVEGYRVWRTTRKVPQKDGTTEDTLNCFILSRSNHEASMRLTEHKHYHIELEFKKRTGKGPGKRKIASSHLIFAKSLADSLFVDATPNGELLPVAHAGMKQVWDDNFGLEGTYNHFLTIDNEWKESTFDD